MHPGQKGPAAHSFPLWLSRQLPEQKWGSPWDPREERGCSRLPHPPRDGDINLPLCLRPGSPGEGGLGTAPGNSPAMRFAIVAVGTKRASSVPRIPAAWRCSSAGGRSTGVVRGGSICWPWGGGGGRSGAPRSRQPPPAPPPRRSPPLGSPSRPPPGLGGAAGRDPTGVGGVGRPPPPGSAGPGAHR